MMSDAAVTHSVVVNLLLIAVGYAIKRLGLIRRDEGRILNRLVLYVTLPALNLAVISETELSWQLLVLPVVSFAAGVLASQLGRLPARALELSREDVGTFVISLCGVMNAMAYPFVEAGFGDEGVRVVAISDLGNAIAIFAFAYYLSFRYSTTAAFDGRQILKKVTTFFPLHAFLLAVVLNVLGIQLSGVLGGMVDGLATINSPLMLLALGVYLEIDVSRDERRVLFTQVAAKYAIGAGVALFTLWALPFEGPTRAVAFLLPFMPTSLSTLLYSVEQDLNPRMAAMLISLTMVISLVLITIMVLGFRGIF